jgi:hypothetical protein
MLTDLLVGVVSVLAVAGGLALVYRAAGGLFMLALRASQESAARVLADVRARHGDVTGMVERRDAAARAARERRQTALLTLLWIAWLVTPLFLGGVREAYGVAAVLWLVPRARISERERR